MARMAKRAAGIMGTADALAPLHHATRVRARCTIHQHDIPLPDPLLAQHPSQHLDFLEELRVGVRLFAPRDGRVPDDGRGIAVAVEDVPVDAVVGGGDLAVREPGGAGVGDAVGEGFGCGAEGAGGGGVPVELGGLVGPEGFGVVEGEGLDLVLGVGGHDGGGGSKDGEWMLFESWNEPPELKYGMASFKLKSVML